MAIPATANNADPNLDPSTNSADRKAGDEAQVPPPLPPQPSTGSVESDPNTVLKKESTLEVTHMEEESRPVDLSSVNDSLRGNKQNIDAIAQQKTEKNATAPMSDSVQDPNTALEQKIDIASPAAAAAGGQDKTIDMETHKTLPQGIVDNDDASMDKAPDIESSEKTEVKEKSEGNMLLVVLLFLSIIALILAGVLVYVYLLSPNA